MRSVQYGSQVIQYCTQVTEGLKSHYLAVERHSGVLLKGAAVTPEKADQMVLKKAKWILQKLKVVEAVDEGKIATGSRLLYLGRSYYVELVQDQKAEVVQVHFNHSRFKITVPDRHESQDQIETALEEFYKTKAKEKLIPRALSLSRKHNLLPKKIEVRRMSKRWGSCTSDNKIIINTNAVKLPPTLIEYVIVHELCHIKVKDHSKAFWAELSKNLPNWKDLDAKVAEIRM